MQNRRLALDLHWKGTRRKVGRISVFFGILRQTHVFFAESARGIGKKLYLCSQKLKTTKKMEASTTTYPQEGLLLVKVSYMSMVKDIRKAISMVKGVENVTLPRRKRISAYERSLRDLEEGACTRQRTWTTCSNNVLGRSMYTIKFTGEFKRQMRMCERRGYDMELLRDVSAYFPLKASCQRNTCPTSYTAIV